MSIIDYVLKISSTFDSKGFEKLTSNLTNTQKNMAKIAIMTGPIVASMTQGVISLGKQLLESSSKIGAYESRFYAITKSEKLANEELQWTFDLARKTATNIHTLTDAYSIFYATAKQSLGQENTRLIMKDWAEIARVTHLSGDAFGRVMYAMRELSSKGAIYADDVKRQLGSAVPGAIEHARKAAEDLGITGANWWDELQKKAKNNQKVVNQFMVSFTKYAHEALASPEALQKSLQQTDATLQGLSNTWEIFKIRLAQSNAFKEMIRLLQKFVIILDWLTQHTEILKQIIIALATVYIVMLGFQVLSFFLMLKAQLVEVNIMLAGIPLLIGLIVMALFEIITHWKKIKKLWGNLPEWLKTIINILYPIIGIIRILKWSIENIIEAIKYLMGEYNKLDSTTQKSLKQIFKLITSLIFPLYGLIDIIDRITEGWGLWKLRIIAAMDTLKENIKNVVSSAEFKTMYNMLRFLPGFNMLPKAETLDTKKLVTENNSRVDLFVNGQGVTTENANTIVEVMKNNMPTIMKAITGGIVPVL